MPWATGESIRIDWLGVEKLFERVINPHSGCFFLTKEQAFITKNYWSEKGWRIDYKWASPLEMACSGIFLPIFKIMKITTKDARFFQVMHHDELWRNHI